MKHEIGDQRLPNRFWNKVELLQNGCWQWTGHRTNGKYGRYGGGERGQYLYAHRVSYEALVSVIPGRFPSGLTIDHLCKNPSCVNPSHMELVSRGVNTLRGNGVTARNAVKTHCPKGHTYDALWGAQKRRFCRTCAAERTRQWRRRLKDAWKAQEGK